MSAHETIQCNIKKICWHVDQRWWVFSTTISLHPRMDTEGIPHPAKVARKVRTVMVLGPRKQKIHRICGPEVMKSVRLTVGKRNFKNCRVRFVENRQKSYWSHSIFSCFFQEDRVYVDFDLGVWALISFTFWPVPEADPSPGSHRVPLCIRLNQCLTWYVLANVKDMKN